MATIICKATGNLTGATTFAAAEAGAGAILLHRNTALGLAPGGSATSPAFTVTNASVIDAVLLWVQQALVGSTGTLTVDLLKSGVVQGTVTVNKTDLPLPTLYHPVLFKLGTTATGDGAATWTIRITNSASSTNNVNYYGTQNTAGYFSRALRTTTAATAAATNDIYVVGELTGAGAHTSYTVTMDSTAATVYGSGLVNSTSVAGGGIHVANFGTLAYGTSSSTNYILRVNGDLIVSANGALSIGSSGSEIPRNSTAVLEFQQTSADCDFGLRCLDYSIINLAGLSRTSGKNIVKCKLAADLSAVNLVAGIPSASSVGLGVGLDATGTSLQGVTATATNTNALHFCNASIPPVTDTTQTATVWLTRGTGTHNRYVRVALAAQSGLTNGFYSDVDLQAGTAGTITAAGNGTATSVSMVPYGTGYLISITGKISSALASNAFFFLYCCSAPGTTFYFGDSTHNFTHDRMSVVNGASSPTTTFNVNTDTGWLASDVVCVATTSRNFAECEFFPLYANAGASSFTSEFASNYLHTGVSPAQAEVGLLTRNVKLRSTSGTLMAYVYCTALSTVTASWAEFYLIGVNAVGKYGISVDSGATANPKSFTYCSVHDSEGQGVVLANAATTSLNVTFSNNVLWNNNVGYFVYVNAAIVNNDYTLDNNLFIRMNAGSGGGIWLNDLGGVVTNNTVAGSNGGGSHGFIFSENGATLGTFSGNSAHGMGGWGVLNNSNITSNGLIDNFTSWRNTGGGFHNNGGDTTNLRFNNFVAFGNPTGMFLGTQAYKLTMIGTNVIAGETAYPATYGVALTVSTIIVFDVVNVDFVGASISLSSPLAPTSADIAFITAGSFALCGWFNNCKFNSNVINSKAAWLNWSYLGFQRYNQTNGDHRTHMKNGLLQTDTVTYRTDTPAMKMTPTSATAKLESAPDGLAPLLPVGNGTTITASVWVRKNPFYVGNQPRLSVRANPSIGIDTDTVLATCSDVTSGTSLATFNLLSHPAMILSNGNLTVQHGPSGNGVTATVLAPQSTGKYYFEIMPVTSLGLSSGFGIMNYPEGTKSITMAYTAGNIFVDGSLVGGIGGWIGVGYWVGFAVDLTNRLCWLRPGGNIGGTIPGNWNNNPAANPATGVGGLAIYPTTAFLPFAVFSSSDASNVYTINLGQSAYAYAAPSGFSNWAMPAYAGTDTWVQISGTTPAAADDGGMEFVVDCDNAGVGGYLDIDDWVFTGAGSPAGNMTYWYEGAPVSAFGQAGGGLKYWFNGLPVMGGAGAAGYFWAGLL